MTYPERIAQLRPTSEIAKEIMINAWKSGCACCCNLPCRHLGNEIKSALSLERVQVAQLEELIGKAWEALRYYDRNDEPNDGVIARQALTAIEAYRKGRV